MTLELRGGGEPIGGRIHDASGRERPFTGWLGLMAAIELLRTDPPAPDTAAGKSADTNWRQP